MDFELSDNHKELQQKMKDFFQKHIAPRASKMDISSSEERMALMRENLDRLSQVGYLGHCIKEDYNGDSMDFVGQCVTAEELAKACASTFISARASAFLFAYPVQSFGTEQQKKAYLPYIAKGGKIGAIAYSEQDAGSDLLAIQASAEKVDKGWVINGTKDIVVNAPIADVFLVLAKTSSKDEESPAFGLFIIDRDTPGLEIGERVETLGLRGAPIAGLDLKDCHVSDEALLGGTPGKGKEQIEDVLEKGRLTLSAMAVGLGVACMEMATQRAKKRVAFGKQIGRFQEVGFKLSDMFTDNDLGRMLTLRAAWAYDNNEAEADILASCAKLFTSEALTRISNHAMQIFAGHGYVKGTDVERVFRDARFVEIAEGTTEIQRVIIAKSVLDKYLPR